MDCDQLETTRENLNMLMAHGVGSKRLPDRKTPPFRT